MTDNPNDADSHEKRRHQRVHTRIEIPYWKYVKVKKDRDVNIGFVKNISKGGFFIETESVYERGTEIGFEFYVPNSAQAISGLARVAWMRQDTGAEIDPTNPPGMGLEFVRFENQADRLLSDFIDSEIRRQKLDA